MRYTIAPLFCRPWTLNGISPRLIESHYENDYGNALDRLNAISEELEALDPATTPGHVVGRLKRDEAIVLNSTLLHELYFASLGGDGRTLPEAMANAIFGFQVSGDTVDELRRRDYDARSLKGGIGARHAIGGPTVPLDRGSYNS
jgi:hypothetical protein